MRRDGRCGSKWGAKSKALAAVGDKSAKGWPGSPASFTMRALLELTNVEV
jgi:hypothetical protein